MENNPIRLIEDMLEYRSMRVLTMMSILSYSSRGKAILDLEKIAIFEFLIDNSEVLDGVLKQHTETLGTTRWYERLESKNINTNLIHDMCSIKKIIIILQGSGLIEAADKQYVISRKGEDVINQLNNEYIEELITTGKKILKLRSITNTRLYKMINTIVEGKMNGTELT